MANYLKLTISLILLTLLAIGVFASLERLLTSAYTYQSPLAQAELPPGSALPNQVPRVVVVVINGLSDPILFNADGLLTLDRLSESGATALMQGAVPSYAQPIWATLISGSPPALNGVIPFDVTSTNIRPVPVDTVFHAAQPQNLQTALAGHADWAHLLPPELLTESFFAGFPDSRGDRAVLERAPIFLEQDNLQLLVFQFNQLNHAALTQGTESEAFRTALQNVDRLLDELVSLLDFSRTTLIVTSDHGHVEDGGFGGSDAEVTALPFIMFGSFVTPGTYSLIEQNDVAPTIAALLGLRFPTANQGQPRLEMLQLSPEDEAVVRVALARQHIFRTEAYLTALNQPLPDVSAINRAEGFLSNGNRGGAAQLADLLVVETRTAQATAEASFDQAAQRWRLVMVLGIILFWAVMAVWQRSEIWGEALTAAATSFGAYHLINFVQQWPYSFSTVGGWPEFWQAMSQRIFFSLLAGCAMLLILLILQQFTEASEILRGSYEFVFFSAGLFLLPALYGFWQHGASIDTVFPNPEHLFWHLTALMHVFWLIVYGAAVPLGIIAVNNPLQQLLLTYQNRRTEQLKARHPTPQARPIPLSERKPSTPSNGASSQAQDSEQSHPSQQTDKPERWP